MIDRRIGTKDPLYRHFKTVVLPRAGLEIKTPAFESVRLKTRETIYFFEEKNSRFCFIGKFFGFRPRLSTSTHRNCLNQEFKNLLLAQKIGLNRTPHRVVRPLSKTEQLNFLLVEDYVRGRDLDYYIGKAAHQGQYERLGRKLDMLAFLLFKLHSSLPEGDPVDFRAEVNGFQLMIEKLVRRRRLKAKNASYFSRLLNEWLKVDEMHAVRSVLVHGDATPTNFIFHHEDGITAIDLERMRMADCLVDISMLAAELKHHFAWRILKAEAAEPLINRFFKIYCAQFPDPEAAFEQMTLRNRFYMALNEIRIARNSWVTTAHRQWLVEEAQRCLYR